MNPSLACFKRGHSEKAGDIVIRQMTTNGTGDEIFGLNILLKAENEDRSFDLLIILYLCPLSDSHTEDDKRHLKKI